MLVVKFSHARTSVTDHRHAGGGGGGLLTPCLRTVEAFTAGRSQSPGRYFNKLYHLLNFTPETINKHNSEDNRMKTLSTDIIHSS